MRNQLEVVSLMATQLFIADRGGDPCAAVKAAILLYAEADKQIRGTTAGPECFCDRTGCVPCPRHPNV